ncbi:MAG TPA: asparaginase [Candidatus Dormibacteraeota bacterium]|nr:asparaginase [Candidatus Dormibacteraeota bacterium]
MTFPALLAEVWRGDAREASIRGHVAVCDGTRVVAAAGVPEVLTTARSAVKPIQALVFVESGAAGALDAGDAELALACASHGGAAWQVAGVRRLLGLAGLDESALACGPQPPSDPSAARALARAGAEAAPVHNNCSGQHAAMLAVCVHRGWPVEGYVAPEHPLQVEIVRTMSELMGVDLEAAPRGVDGCGMPTHGIPLASLAAGMARAQAERPAFRRLQDAMAARPDLVGRAGGFDCALLAACGDRLTAKSGGAAVWVAVDRRRGEAVAVKLEAGSGEHLPPIAAAVLEELGMLPPGAREAIAEATATTLRNWAGAAVGTTVVRAHLDRDAGVP